VSATTLDFGGPGAVRRADLDCPWSGREEITFGVEVPGTACRLRPVQLDRCGGPRNLEATCQDRAGGAPPQEVLTIPGVTTLLPPSRAPRWAWRSLRGGAGALGALVHETRREQIRPVRQQRSGKSPSDLRYRPRSLSPRGRALYMSRRPPPREEPDPTMSLFSGLPAAVSAKAATGLAVAALAAGGTAALAVTSHGPSSVPAGVTLSVTRADSTADPTDSSTSPSPEGAHGQAVTSAVASCKAALAARTARPTPGPGSHGIGQCVAAVASDGRAHSHQAGAPTSGAAPTHPTPPAHPTGKP
jgi:hypothetical protein